MQDFVNGNLKEGDHLEDLSVDGRIILKCIFSQSVRLICLRIGTCGEIL
jgi:hypothetical protein